MLSSHLQQIACLKTNSQNFSKKHPTSSSSACPRFCSVCLLLLECPSEVQFYNQRIHVTFAYFFIIILLASLHAQLHSCYLLFIIYLLSYLCLHLFINCTILLELWEMTEKVKQIFLLGTTRTYTYKSISYLLKVGFDRKNH